MSYVIRYTDNECDENQDGVLSATISGHVELTTDQRVVANRKDCLTVANLTGFPQRGDYYSYNGVVVLSLLCFNRKIKQRGTEHPGIFDFTLNYSNDFPDGGFEQNPLLMPTKYEYGFEQFQKFLERDMDNLKIANSAGDPFTDAPPIDDSRPLITATRNEAYYNPSLMDLYKDSINQSAVTIQGYSYPAYSLKLRDISGSPASGSGINYYVVRYGLYANRDLWKPHKLLDKGWRSFDEGDGNTPEPIKDERGQVLPNESLLNGSGLAQTAGATPYYKEFSVYKVLNFSILGL